MKLLITGSTGYIGKHIVATALARGHNVRATLRTASREAEVRDAVAHGPLDFITAELLQDAGWAAAMDGIDAVLHTASPVPLRAPKHTDSVLGPAIEGTERVLDAARAAGVERVILTSSIAAIQGGAHKTTPYGPDDWTDPDHPDVGVYARSKTLAERAAWAFVAEKAPQIALTTVNPGFVFGTPRDRTYGSSIKLLERIFRGIDPALPRLSFACVAVQDVAEAHLAAVERPEHGRAAHRCRRPLAVDEGHRRYRAQRRSSLKTRSARSARLADQDRGPFQSGHPPQVTSDIGWQAQFDYTSLREVLTGDPIPPQDAIAETAKFIGDKLAEQRSLLGI